MSAVKMPVLITGATGFVGSHLAEFLLLHKENIWGTYLFKDFANVETFRSKITLLKCDITDFKQIQKVLKESKPQEVYHLAASSSVGRSFSQPTEVYRQNFISTLNLLEAVRQLKLNTRVLIAGSAEMYGQVWARDLPIKETQPLNPISPYGVSKAMCDMLAHQYFLNYGIETIRVRAFNHIGPRQSLGFVIPDFVSQVARIHLGMQRPVLKVGNLKVERDFTDVRDIVRGYCLLMQKGNPGQAYNLACGKAYSLRKIVNLLRQLTPAKMQVQTHPSKKRVTDIPILLGDATKARRLAGWKPQIDIRTTLQDTLNYWVDKIASSPEAL